MRHYHHHRFRLRRGIPWAFRTSLSSHQQDPEHEEGGAYKGGCDVDHEEADGTKRYREVGRGYAYPLQVCVTGSEETPSWIVRYVGRVPEERTYHEGGQQENKADDCCPVEPQALTE